MPFKGLFNLNNKREEPVKSADEWDKQILRLNSLEVQIKKLLEFERQVRASLYRKKEDMRSGKEDSLLKPKPSPARHSPEDKNEHLKIRELARRMDKLEDLAQRLGSRLQDSSDRALKHDQEFSERKEEEELLFSLIDRRVAALEQHYASFHELQAGLVKQMDELIEKQNELMEKQNELMEKRGGAESSALRQDLPFKTLYIDKLYLDKYEQNNNIAQIGIHELGGALNIGATYGKDVIPSSVTEDVKEEIEKMKATFQEGEGQPEPDQPEEPQPESSASEFTPIFLEDDELQ